MNGFSSNSVQTQIIIECTDLLFIFFYFYGTIYVRQWQLYVWSLVVVKKLPKEMQYKQRSLFLHFLPVYLYGKISLGTIGNCRLCAKFLCLTPKEKVVLPIVCLNAYRHATHSVICKMWDNFLCLTPNEKAVLQYLSVHKL